MNSLISRQLNTLRGGKGTNFEKGYSEIEIADEASMHRLSAYTLANPCAANLVKSADAWQGFSTYRREYNKPFTVTRPKCGMWAEYAPASGSVKMREKNGKKHSKFDSAKEQSSNETKDSKPARRKPSKLPNEVQAVLTRPNIKPELSNEALRAEIRKVTNERELLAEKKRKQSGHKVLGWSEVIKKRWNQFPNTPERVFEEVPRIATECDLIREHKLNLISVFNQAHEFARRVYIDDDPRKAIFPYGTWKMCKELNANCEARPPT